MQRLLTYGVNIDGSVVRRNGNTRADLVPGTYKPSATTTGTYLTGLPAYNATSTQTVTVTTDNTVFQNLTIYGDIIVQAAGLIIRNCVLRGGPQIPTHNLGIVDCNNSKCFNALIEDCTIQPQRPSYYRDGIVGHEYTSRRNHIYNTNDGMGAFILSSVAANANVAIEANYVHDLTYWNPDPAHSDGTHNDGLQIQGGGNIHVIGNFFHDTAVLGAGSSYPPNYDMLTVNPTHASGSGTLIQKQSTTSPLVNVVVEKNWYSNGNCGIQIQAGNYTVQNNIFSHTFYDYNHAYPYPTRYPSMYMIRGAAKSLAAGVMGLNSNFWEDTGLPLLDADHGGTRNAPATSSQYLGIRWNDTPD